MLRTWFTKPLPWILISLVFFVGYQAIRWREALFGLYLYRVPLDFHEVVFYGFTALYNDIVVPSAIFLILVCGSLVGLTSHDFTFDLDRVQLRSLRFLRAWKTISKSPFTLKDSVRIFWDARPQGPGPYRLRRVRPKASRPRKRFARNDEDSALASGKPSDSFLF